MNARRLVVNVERRGTLCKGGGEWDCGGDVGNEDCRDRVIVGGGSGWRSNSSASINPSENMSMDEVNGKPSRTYY